MLRVGVVGYGHWGPNYARILREAPDAVLAAVCDRSADRCAQARLDHPDVAVVASSSELFSRNDVDAVVVATPAETHAELGRAALQAGRHVLVEKPLGMDRLEVEALVAAAAAAGLVLMVDHTYLFSDAVAELERIVAGGVLGGPFHYRSIRTNPGRVAGPVGVLRDLAVHDLSILDRLHSGLPESVWATVPPSDGLGADGLPAEVVELGLAYVDGSTAAVTSGWGLTERARLVELTSPVARVLYDDLALGTEVRVLPGPDGHGPGPHPAHDPAAEHDLEPPSADAEPLGRAVAHFVDAVAAGTEPITGGASAARLARILDAAQRSLDAEGAEVPLGEVETLG